jgi:hypothetical protein
MMSPEFLPEEQDENISEVNIDGPKIGESIYQREGYANRAEYLQSLADDFGVDLSTVQALADVLGPNEDFDGLVTTLEDMC